MWTSSSASSGAGASRAERSASTNGPRRPPKPMTSKGAAFMAFEISGLSGKVALVCGGGGGGSGAATSRNLVQAGATVFVVDRTDELVEEIVKELSATGARAS